jgi:hypothetical protein
LFNISLEQLYIRIYIYIFVLASMTLHFWRFMTEESQPGGLSKLLDEDSQANPGKGPSTVGRMAHVLLRVLVCFFCVVYIYK